MLCRRRSAHLRIHVGAPRFSMYIPSLRKAKKKTHLPFHPNSDTSTHRGFLVQMRFNHTSVTMHMYVRCVLQPVYPYYFFPTGFIMYYHFESLLLLLFEELIFKCQNIY
ncbi:hypothetical protein ABB37_08759 [Leptomonas pyrrhocoris]|uniref:Uncharacterized protein n=1 Tax=Leptomonas pyrrhocoris TaxID=157538 RepID=A0A0N0DS47_LEPPY|nr:hypothetical protein ABB37_08759 [Leptomonas pyrrhocoris]KPA75081.1 hypothetical protein ABB37_08759 [Leptomonas pyrrhocoris]|eukprot:XP_015653520.1 hypothetical protein ABB37_08759 [Leptomonas pyrrhocoris]